MVCMQHYPQMVGGWWQIPKGDGAKVDKEHEEAAGPYEFLFWEQIMQAATNSLTSDSTELHQNQIQFF